MCFIHVANCPRYVQLKMIPTVIGGAIVYEVARQQPMIVQQHKPLVVQPQNQSCSPWTETQNPDGTITPTRTWDQ